MSRRPDRVIISCAMTGGIHTPTMSPALPVTPDMLAEQGIEAARAGAAILHVHARDPRDGRPTPDPEVYRPSCRGSRPAATPWSTSPRAAA